MEKKILKLMEIIEMIPSLKDNPDFDKDQDLDSNYDLEKYLSFLLEEGLISTNEYRNVQNMIEEN